jgi:hypothetical protein
MPRCLIPIETIDDKIERWRADSAALGHPAPSPVFWMSDEEWLNFVQASDLLKPEREEFLRNWFECLKELGRFDPPKRKKARSPRIFPPAPTTIQ